MKKTFTVRLVKITREHIDFEVEAEDQYEAEELAQDEAWETDEEWDCDDQEIEVIRVEEIEE